MSAVRCGHCAYPLDRDLKRRRACTKVGYVFRLINTFVRSTAVYQHRTDLDAEEARAYRIQRAREIFGRRLGIRNTLSLPSAYALPKSKCFQGSQWNCIREHEHERIIVSSPRDSIARHMRCVARCIRLITKASGLFPPLWKDSRQCRRTWSRELPNSAPWKAHSSKCVQQLSHDLRDANATPRPSSRHPAKRHAMPWLHTLFKSLKGAAPPAFLLVAARSRCETASRRARPLTRRNSGLSRLKTSEWHLLGCLRMYSLTSREKSLSNWGGLAQGSPLSPVLARC
jgi:hypothetical protein